MDELRKRHFATQLHLFDYKRCYEGIVRNKYFCTRIQSVKDLYDVIYFCEQHDCFYYLTEERDVLGLMAVIKQNSHENPLFHALTMTARGKHDMLITYFCVN
jgi:hypothetical protein